MTPFSLLEHFQSYLGSEKRYSSHTLLAYRTDLKQFIEFSQIKESKELNEVTRHLIRSWVIALNDQQIENKSINRKLATLRTFYKWLLRNNYVDQNPTLKIQGPKQQKRLPVFAKESEMESKKLDGLFGIDFSGLRDKLIFELFYQTGIRLSELIELTHKQVTASQIRVIGKRNKERIIPISQNLTEQINQYIRLKDWSLIDHDYLLVLDNGNKMYPKFVYRKINQYLSIATNLDVKSPHVLRHTFATHLLNNGAGLETLKALLGHSSLAATQVYTHNSFAQLTKIYSSAHPRGRKKD